MGLLRRKRPEPEKRPEPVVYKLPPIIKSPSMPEFHDLTAKPAGKTPVKSDAIPVAFHKPTSYRPSFDLAAERRKSAAYSLASTNAAPSASSVPSGRTPKRVVRSPPTFNLLCAGAHSTGKTAYIKTLLSQLNLPHSTSEETKQGIARFGCDAHGRVKPTLDWGSLSVEVMEKGDRLHLTVHDTPGFAHNWADDFEAEMTVNDILKKVETRYYDSLRSENQVVRINNKTLSDHHIHLILYFLNPSSFSSPSRRPGMARKFVRHFSPTVAKSKSSPSLREKGASDNSLRDFSPREDQATEWDIEEIGMHPTDLRLIKKISKRANVLPIIARADEVTTSRLSELRAAVLRDFRREGLTFGVLHYDDATGSPGGATNSSRHFPAPTNLAPLSPEPPMPIPPIPTLPDDQQPKSNGMSQFISAPELMRCSSDDSDTIPQLNGHLHANPPRLVRVRSRSKSITRRKTLAEIEIDLPTPSTATLQKSLPFAIMTPEILPDQAFESVPITRVYPWGKIDILAPEYSDFELARFSILSTYMKDFREQTRMLYEDYRTGKLLAKRATLSPTQQRQVLAELSSI